MERKRTTAHYSHGAVRSSDSGTMPENTRSTRLYTEQEVSDLLRRAAELQDADSGITPRSGLSLTQIEQAAAEVGIDPRYVRAAAQEPTESKSTAARAFHLFGGPMGMESNRIVMGEANLEQWETIVREARCATGENGHIGNLGNAWEWSTSEHSMEETHLSVRPQTGQTQIQIVQSHEGVAYLYYLVFSMLSLFISLGVVSGIKAAPAVEWSLAMACFTGLFLIIRAVFGGYTRKKRLRQNELMERLAVIVETQPVTETTANITAALPAAVSFQPAQEPEQIQITLSSR